MLTKPTMKWLSAVAVVASASFSGPPQLAGATGPGEDAGSVVIVDPLNETREYLRGDTTSAFTLRLPDGAACPGDSANDGWRVQTFIVPADTDLSRLEFVALRPASDLPLEYRSLREINGGIYTQQMTQANTVVGEPGSILGLPPLTFAYFKTGTFPPGTYQLGVACTTPDWVVRRYWNAEIVFEPAPEVDPGGMRWSFLGDRGDGEVAAGVDENFPVFAAGLVGVVGVGIFFVGVSSFRRRRVTSVILQAPTSREDLA